MVQSLFKKKNCKISSQVTVLPHDRQEESNGPSTVET